MYYKTIKQLKERYKSGITIKGLNERCKLISIVDCIIPVIDILKNKAEASEYRSTGMILTNIMSL